MWSTAHARRFVYLFHRWSGIGFCLLMLLWLVSGVVMLFIGYPKLLPQERLQALPVLEVPGCCVPAEVALAHSRAPAQLQELTLTRIGGQPRYRLREGDGTLRLVDAGTGRLLPPADEAVALAGARAFLPGAPARLLGQVEDDRWTHGRALDAHRPLYQVQMDDAQATLLYVSSATGEVVLDAPQAQRYWNFVGAWLHWLYLLRDGSHDPVWTWLLIILSAAGTLSVVAGACTGLWRWRFQGRYKSGRRTPYRSLPMRWHHVAGLSFGLILILWMFSGLMSMNPLGIFSAAHGRPDLAAYRQGTAGSMQATLTTNEALALLRDAGFATSELEWKVLAASPYLLARSASGDSRLIVRSDQIWTVQERWPDAQLITAAASLRPAAIVSVEILHDYDAYYYERQEASMYAGNARRLPVIKLVFADPGKTCVYLDPRSGDLVQSVDGAQRAGRWLFNFLHSWDLPSWLRAGVARETTLILLSLGGLLIAASGIFLAVKRLLLATQQARQRR
ncbi:PepSY domain-containing protein [Rhodoferax sp. BAB1]|uniref:PepSY domain-containing protein n=1 Tax=Rhodoferax sp. BAB1 TaxID=2741720 RepID=UPI001577251C|nr:PepSY domain-containing protein [Rhodoferax sp. BAB1]QKO23115.1 PepSY domain-containing protein [Rhodoferax sp. BAB1]